MRRPGLAHALHALAACALAAPASAAPAGLAEPAVPTALGALPALGAPPALTAPIAIVVPAAPVVLVAPARLVARASAARGQADALARLSTWLERHERSRDVAPDPESSALLAEILWQLDKLEEREPERAAGVAVLLLRLAAQPEPPLAAQPGARAARPGARAALPGARAMRVPAPLHATPVGTDARAPAERGRAALARRLDRSRDGALARRLAATAADEHAPRAERLVAARLCAGRFVPGTLAALLAAARAPERDVAREAQRALAGWPDVGLEVFFLDELEHGHASPSVVRTHFAATRDALGAGSLASLRAVAGRMLVSDDWRTALRALPLFDALDARSSVPLLIEALRAWMRRAEQGTSSRRVRHEITQALERVSGRSLGEHPDRWWTWWTRVGDGTIELSDDAARAGDTRASFFGLPIVSDRVQFVLDRSGSMETRFASDGRSRYAEAVAQLFLYLERAGPETRFDVLLFDDRTERFAPRLEEATPATLARLASWLGRERVGGGTRLREAVLEAAACRDGRVALDELAADTLVVLCDGETESGPDWVRPWLEEIADETQLAIACVQIGEHGDGTLEALAGMGGTFVRVP